MKFSITIPAYKQKYLYEAIESCLVQSYKDFELIVVDDASPEDLKSIVDMFSDPRLRYFRNKKNCGAINVVDNWNICIGYASGDYVICMGDDDKLLPNCLEEYAKLINKYKGVGLLHGWTEIINEKSEVTKLTTHRCEFESSLSLMWHRSHAYGLQFIGDFCFERDWLMQNGGFFKLPYAWGSDDISAFIAASKNGVANTQIPVFQYRVNSQTISNTGNADCKIKAIALEYKWKNEVLTRKSNSNNDELYRKELLDELAGSYQKKCGLTIASDLKKKSFLRLFYWISVRKKFHLEIKTLFYAFIQSLK